MGIILGVGRPSHGGRAQGTRPTWRRMQVRGEGSGETREDATLFLWLQEAEQGVKLHEREQGLGPGPELHTWLAFMRNTAQPPSGLLK